MTLFKNKYRIESARRQGWDYSENGYYFITVCTKDRKKMFGEIKNNEMELNDYGKIVQNEWKKSFEIRKELYCEIYTIMPNHLHAIISIVETHGRASLQNTSGVAYRTPKSISSFIAGFKSTVTKQINQKKNSLKVPIWQPRFHDRIIRDDIELYNVKIYIQNNPINWTEDEFYDL